MLKVSELTSGPVSTASLQPTPPLRPPSPQSSGSRIPSTREPSRLGAPHSPAPPCHPDARAAGRPARRPARLRPRRPVLDGPLRPGVGLAAGSPRQPRLRGGGGPALCARRLQRPRCGRPRWGRSLWDSDSESGSRSTGSRREGSVPRASLFRGRGTKEARPGDGNGGARAPPVAPPCPRVPPRSLFAVPRLRLGGSESSARPLEEFDAATWRASLPPRFRACMCRRGGIPNTLL